VGSSGTYVRSDAKITVSQVKGLQDKETYSGLKLKFRCLFIHTDTSRAAGYKSTVGFANTGYLLSKEQGALLLFLKPLNFM